MRIMLDTNVIISYILFKNDKMDVECINIDEIVDTNLFEIRDKNDYIVLYSALKGNVDIFITGDDDFKHVNVDRPKIMNINEYMNQFYKF